MADSPQGTTWVPHSKEIIANLVFKRRESEVQREWERECSESLYLHLRFLGSHNRIQRERCILFSTPWLLHGLQWVLFFLFSLFYLLSSFHIYMYILMHCFWRGIRRRYYWHSSSTWRLLDLFYQERWFLEWSYQMALVSIIAAMVIFFFKHLF